MMDDIEIHEKVCRAIFRDRLIDPYEVQVSVRNGIVALTGNVADRKAKLHVEECLKDVQGIEKLVNKLKVKPDHGLVGDMDWPI